MASLVFSLALFAAVPVLQLAWWRWRLPVRHTRALLTLAALVPAAAALLAWLGGFRFGLVWADLPGIALFYAGAMACYLITYAGVEETSPSLVIVRTLERAGPAGCTPGELGGVITAERFITPRLQALARDGLIVNSGQAASLTPAGRRLARLTLRFARIFNLDEGG
jgi:hypothetical protein